MKKPSNLKSAKPKRATRRKGPGALEDHIVEMALNGDLARISRAAIQKQLDLGLPVTFERDGKIIKRFSDGKEEILGVVKRAKYKLPKGVQIIGRK